MSERSREISHRPFLIMWEDNGVLQAIVTTETLVSDITYALGQRLASHEVKTITVVDAWHVWRKFTNPANLS